MKKLITQLILIFILTSLNAQEVTISGNRFTVNGSEIWFNGINTPWHLFVDFGRSDFNYKWWTDEFAKYKANHINLARVWIHCSGEVSPNINESGHVSGVSSLFWEHMDHLIKVATDNKVYVMPALLSFDITKQKNKYHKRWRKWLQSESNIQSYIDNVLIPIIKRYNDKPYLLAWEICNEPEWMFENKEHGPQSFNDVQKMHAMFAAAIHENCTKPVTTGSAAPKWNSPIYKNAGPNAGNMYSNEALSATINNPKAYLDFYQYHWYPWQSQWFKSPFTQTTKKYGVDDRPVIVGESEGKDVCDKYVCQTVIEMYESAYNNGFDGVCAWKTPQNDGHGTFENIAKATNAFYKKHPKLVYPDGSDPIPVKGISLSKTSITIQIRDLIKLTATITPPDATDKRVIWTSSDDSIVPVTNGMLTGKGIGTAIITAKTVDGGYTASCTVKVIKRQAICPNPVSVTLPFSKDGIGEFCWFTKDNINYINSWNMKVVEVNGVDYTNTWSNSMPAKVDGGYYINCQGNYSWSHFEAAAPKAADGMISSNEIQVYPNPFREFINIKIDNPELVNSIVILDQLGRTVNMLDKSQITSLFTFGLNYNQGIYVVKVNTINEVYTFLINKNN